MPLSTPIYQHLYTDNRTVFFPVITTITTTINDTTLEEILPVAENHVIAPDSPQSPISKYFTIPKIIWTFDDYWIQETYYPPHKGFGGLSQKIHSYGGYVGIMSPFIPNWIGQKFNNQIRNYSVVNEFSRYSSKYSQNHINASLEFFNQSYIEPECHGWNHSEELNHATLSYAYQIVNYTLWNWYNNYHIQPRFWLGHDYDGNYNISLALKKFSERYWTVYAEYFIVDSTHFPNNSEPAVEYIGNFFDPCFGCTFGHPCKTVQEAQRLFNAYAQNKEIIAIRAHPWFLNDTTLRARENLTKWQQFIDWIYQTHTYLNFNHTEAIQYKIDRNNFTVEKNNDNNYTINLSHCKFNHRILFTNPDGTGQRNWSVTEQSGHIIGIVHEDVFFQLNSTAIYYLTTQEGPGPQPPGWWNTSWKYRKTLTITHTKIPALLTNFPVLIQLRDTDIKLKAQPDGDDIVFVDKNGIRFPHEIEKYTNTNGDLVAWVSVSSLSPTQDSTFYMYYGNPLSQNQQQREETWDTHYLAVQHLEELSGTVYDSTSNHRDGPLYGSPRQNTVGRIDGAVLFDGVGDHILLPRMYTNENQFTIEAWIYAQSGARYFLSQRSSTGVFIQLTSNYLQYYINGISDGKTVTLNAWYHVVLTYDGVSAKLYLNGVVKSKPCSPPTWPADGMYVGDRSGGGRQFIGIIDEVRFSNIARSNAWVTTCYNNQNNPAGFIHVGTEES